MTADLSRIEATRLIEKTAAEWAVRLSLSSPTASERAELDVWLGADVRHQGALIRAQAAWVDLDRVSALNAREASLPSILSSQAAESAFTRRTLLAAGLGAVALTGASAALWLWSRRGDLFESEIGEIRRVTLSDGSTMVLDSATKAEVRFSDARREIELVRGQGLFEVTKDPARPFVVLARGVSVRAVGTAFTVRAVDQNVAVTVTEGVVEVSDNGPGGSTTPERVSADERAVVSGSRGIAVQAIPAAQVERHLSWREGLLSFDGESLAEAVAEVNRHNVLQIQVDDPALAARPVVGIFRTTDPEGFAQTVAAALGAESRSDGDMIHLAARR